MQMKKIMKSSIMSCMADLEKSLQRLVSCQLNVLEHDRRCLSIEWHFLRRPLQEVVIDPLLNEFLRSTSNLESENKRLKSQLNQLSFRSIPERDEKIVQLRRQGFSRGQIAKLVGMSKWGVSKAIQRLDVQDGINPVDPSYRTP